MRTEKREVVQVVDVYISDDGQDFGQDEMACFKHELYLRKKSEIAAAEHLELKELFGTKPIAVNCTGGDECMYRWFRMNSEGEFEVLKKVYDESFPTPTFYPEVICIVTPRENVYTSEAQGYLLSCMRKETADFWNTMNCVMPS